MRLEFRGTQLSSDGGLLVSLRIKRVTPSQKTTKTSTYAWSGLLCQAPSRQWRDVPADLKPVDSEADTAGQPPALKFLAFGRINTLGMGELFFIVMALAAAGFAKGVVGLGFPPIAMGLLVLVMPPVEAAVIMVIPALLTNFWQGVCGPYLLGLLRRFWLMFILTALMTLTFAGALVSHAEVALKFLGALLVIYGAYSLKKPQMALRPGAELWIAPLSGAVTGLVTAFTGVLSMPSVPLLQSVGLNRDALVQAMGVSFTISAFALAVTLGVSGNLTDANASLITAATLAAFVGMAAGSRLRRTFDEKIFRNVFLWALIVLGAYLLLG